MTHSASITTAPGRVQQTLVIENVQNQDTVTLVLEINVDCNCIAKTASYTNTSFTSGHPKALRHAHLEPGPADSAG